MPDFLGPSQIMSQQLQGVVAGAAQTAMDNRASLAQQQLNQQRMAKEIETNLSLSDKLMPVNKDLALEYFNAALKPMGRAVTMDNFDVASKVFAQAAEMKQQGDMAGMSMLLKQSDKFMINLADQARAIQMQREAGTEISGQRASAIQNLQPENPQLARSRELLNMANMVGGDLSRINPDELVRITGTTDPTEHESLLQRASTIVEGHDQHRKHLATLYNLDPGAFGKSADATAIAQANPEILAKGRISELLQKPDRTEDEERELLAKGSVYTPHMADALGLKSAQREREKLNNQLEDTRTRMNALGDHLGTHDQAALSVSSLTESTKSLPDAGKPLDDTAAKQHLLAEGVRSIEGQTFTQKVQPRIQTLEKTAQEADAQRERLARMAVSALPGQKDAITAQIKEFESMAGANKAMARLLQEENPYAIATREAELALMDDPKQKAAAEASLAGIKTQRERDLKAVQDEQARLARREAILQSRMPAAERKEEQERNLRSAHQAVDAAVLKGQSLTVAVREAGEKFGVNKAELAKNVMEARGSGLWDAQNQFAMLPTARQTTQEAGKIAARYGVSAKDVLEGTKLPNKPLVEINTSAKASEEAAKDFTKSTRTTYDQLKAAPILLRNIDEAKALIPQAKGFMGPGGESLMEAAKFLNSRLGAKINIAGIKGAEELRTRIFFNIMENLKKMDAQPSQMQQQLMMDALGKLGTDPNALANVLDAYGDTIRDKVELFNQEVSGAMQKGTDFPYDPRIVVPERRAPGGESIVKSDADYERLPSGTVFIGPDGKKRKKP